MRSGWVYIITNRPNGTLYIGVTSDLARRIAEHRQGAIDGFSKKYKLTQLVYFECHETIEEAIRREKILKTWRRAWKVRLIHEANLPWHDLYDVIAG